MVSEIKQQESFVTADKRGEPDPDYTAEEFYFQIKAFFKAGKPVHCVDKGREWANGYIKEVYGDFCIIDDFKDGLTPMFYNNIIRLNLWVERRDKKVLNKEDENGERRN